VPSSEPDAAKAGRTIDLLHQRAVANLAALTAKQQLRTPKYQAITRGCSTAISR
jgi:hypothetical protein